MRGFVTYAGLALKSYFAFSRNSASRVSVKRLLVMTCFYAVFFPWLLFNVLCLALDHVFFGFRRIEPKPPLFVVGVPRSGTTFLYRLLAMDENQFTTMPLWELILAPALVQKYFFAMLGWIDSTIFFALGRKILIGIEKKLFGSLDAIHKTSLFEPEEDYLALIPVVGCFLMVQPFPDSQRIWQLADFDRNIPEDQRRLIMKFYRGILQRHLYFRGNEKILLSKNPSFSSMIGSLRETFPDCRIIGCVRDPLQTVPSLLNSMKDGGKVFGNRYQPENFQEPFLAMLSGYYEQIFRSADVGEIQISNYRVLTTTPDVLLADIYDAFALNMEPEFEHELKRQAEKSRKYKSGHRYSLEDFELTEDEVSSRFRKALDKIQLL